MLQYLVFPQETFFQVYQTPKHERAFECIQTQNGKYILVGDRATDYNYDTITGISLLVDEFGNIENELLYNDPVYNTRFTIVTSLPNDDQFLIIGSKDSVVGVDSYSKIIEYIVDSSLTLIQSNSFFELKNHLTYPWKCEIVDDTILYLLIEDHPLPDSMFSQQLGVAKIRLLDDSLSSYFNQGTGSSSPHYAQDIIFSKSSSIVKVFFMGSDIDESNLLKILYLDTNLNYITSFPAPGNNISSTPCATHFNDSIYILTATSSPTLSIPIQHIISYKMSSFTDTILSFTEYVNSFDTILYAGAGTNTAICGNSIFITGIYNIKPFQFPWQTSPIWIQITKMDIDLNILSHHFYGGDAQYMPYCITATSDGGAFITGFTWNYTIPGNEQWDIFALKVDTAGLVTNIPDDATWQMNDAILCPNPGSEYCIAFVGAQHPEATLLLHDMNGRQIMAHKLHQPQTRINTVSLPTGPYIYKFIAQGNVIGTGKWIKQ